MGMLRKLVGFVWDIFESVTFAMALFVVAYLFFFQPGIVKGSSSYPTWKTDERFLTEKITYRFGLPQRGDFVVIVSPRNADIDFIKRVVGLPGESIRLKSCQVYINNALLSEPYLQPNTCTAPESFLRENVNYQIPGDSYFLLGDNRPGSSDSRDFGPIPKSKIVGKVIFRYWPPERIAPINTP